MTATAPSLAAAPGDTPAPTLTPRQEAFARHYAASGNGAAAARAAGYAPDGAKQTAHGLLQHPGVAVRIAVLEDAHGRTLRGEVAVLLDRLDTAVELAVLDGDYRAILDIARLQAQIAALTGPEAARRRALLYDRAGGPGPLARSRHCLDPHAALDADDYAQAAAARLAAEIAADEAVAAELAARRAKPAAGASGAAGRARTEAGIGPGRKSGRESGGRGPDPDFSLPPAGDLAGIAAELAALEAELDAGRREADPDFSLPPAGALPRTGGKRPPAATRAALLASAAPVRVPEVARQAA